MLTLTLTTPMTDAEAGAAAALLLTLNPDAVMAALEGLDRDQMRLPLVRVSHSGDVSLVAQPTGSAPDLSDAAHAPPISAAEAFAAPGTQPPEAGVPSIPPAPPAAPVASATGPDAAASMSPTIAAPATAPAVSSVELDSTGLPWDKRIHSDPPTLTKKGPWRAKRGLNQLTAHAVEAELRAALAAPGAPSAPPPPPPVETPAARTLREAVEGGLVPGAPPLSGAPGGPMGNPPPPAPVAATPPPPPAPAPAAAPPPPVSAASAPPVSAPSPVPPAPSPAPSAPTDDTPVAAFASAMRKVTAAQAAGHMTVEETNVVVAQLGLAAVRDLITRPDLLPTFEASVQLHVDRYATGG